MAFRKQSRAPVNTFQRPPRNASKPTKLNYTCTTPSRPVRRMSSIHPSRTPLCTLCVCMRGIALKQANHEKGDTHNKSVCHEDRLVATSPEHQRKKSYNHPRTKNTHTPPWLWNNTLAGASLQRAPLPVHQLLQLFERQKDKNGRRLETRPCGEPPLKHKHRAFALK